MLSIKCVDINFDFRHSALRLVKEGFFSACVILEWLRGYSSCCILLEALRFTRLPRSAVLRLPTSNCTASNTKYVTL